MHLYDTPEYMAMVLDAYGIDHTQTKVLCPFHADVNPSMSIDLAKSRVYCFGCQKSYTAMQFVEASEPELNKLQIYAKMATIAGKTKIQLDPKKLIVNDSDIEQLLIQAKDYYYNLPKTNWLKEDSDELQYLLNRGFSRKILNSSGAKINYNAWYPVVFPIYDNNVFKGWLCRTTNKEVEAKRKYLYNRGFRRRTCLCGRYNNRSPLVIVEGYMDMLMLRQAGLKNVIATLGWKMSSEQRNMLKDANITNIVSALDNDEKGEEGYRFLLSLGFNKVDKWKYRKSQKDPGDQSKSDVLKIAKYYNLIVDK